MKRIILLSVILFTQCKEDMKSKEAIDPSQTSSYALNFEQANHLAQLPLNCIQQEFPNKLGQVLTDSSDLGTPKELHPTFYGCLDWHSSVHGHWMLVKLLKEFPQLENRELILTRLKENITKENIKEEVDYFNKPFSQMFERTYGWAWLLKLAEELHTWQDPLAQELEANLQPLTDLIVYRFMDFLPRLKYPVRVGEHTNTGFGLAFAWDFSNTTQNYALKALIEKRAKEFYLADKECPLSWEPSGYDFLSPCLTEADLMRRVLDKEDFRNWMADFLPQMIMEDFSLEPGIVSDRTDGKLVHLDGVNFSRAWALYGIANEFEEFQHLRLTADQHIAYSFPNIVDGDYMGEHWLASFAVYALDQGTVSNEQ